MQRILLFVSLLIPVAHAWGQELQPPQDGANAQAVASTADVPPLLNLDAIASKPPLGDLLGVLARSGLRSATTTVLLAYDETGKVVGVKLDHTTGSKRLDAAILGWAAKVRLDVREAGVGALPLTFRMD